MVANSFGKESKANSNPESHNFDIFNCVLFLTKLNQTYFKRRFKSTHKFGQRIGL